MLYSVSAIRLVIFMMLLASLPFLTGCTVTGAAVGAGASTGIAAAQEGGIRGALTDAAIQAKINDLWFRHDFTMFQKVDMTVDQGRVLLTGVVQKPEHRVDAVRLAWQVEGVKQVINEIKVANSEGIQGFLRDNWITAQLRTRLTFDKEVSSINYSIDTVQATVYLMGVGQNQAEIDRVVDIARTIKGVRNVVSHVKIAGRTKTAAGSQPQSLTNSPSPKSPYDGEIYGATERIHQDIDYQTAPVAPVEAVTREEAQ